MSDLISRQAAIDAVCKYCEYYYNENVIQSIKEIPSAQPEITDKQAIEHLQESGWMQNHDKQMYEMGLREQLADDSDSYNALLPSARPEQQWIPCSERLPEDYQDVLVWFEYYRYGDYNRLYQMHGIGSYSTEYDSWMINHETGWHKLRVIAWMPLPEPYKERREE